MRAPIISVVVPTYCPGEFLREAVESVLSQTIRDIQVVLVEDGSHTAMEVVSEYQDKITYVWQENRGVSSARNTGVRVATAPWLAFLDHDDFWKPEKLERQLILAERSRRIEVIHTDHFTLRAGEMLPGPRLIPSEVVPSGCVDKVLFQNNFLILSSTLVSKRAFLDAGGFNSRHIYAQDYDLWLRLARRCEFGFVNERVTVYRDHESLSSNHAAALADCADVLATFLIAYPEVWKEFGADLIRTRMSAINWEAAYAYLGEGAHRMARRLFSSAWRWNITQVRPLIYSLVCLMGSNGIRAARAIKRAAS